MRVKTRLISYQKPRDFGLERACVSGASYALHSKAERVDKTLGLLLREPVLGST